MHLSLCQKHKLRVDNAVNNLFCVPDPTLGIVYFDSWQIHELRVAIMSNVPKSGFERTNVKAKRNKIVKKLNDSIKVEIK